MVDWWLLNSFRRHPARVATPDEAQVQVIGTPFSTAFRAHRGVVWSDDAQVAGGPFGCGNTNDYYLKTSAMARYLTELPYWKDRSKSFVVLNSFYLIKDILGDELLATLVDGAAIFTTSDKDYNQFKELKEENVSPFVLPYKVHYRLEDFAWLSLEGLPPKPRSHNLMFHGSTTRGTKNDYTDGELRQLICDNLGPAVDGPHELRCFNKEWSGVQQQQVASQVIRDKEQNFRTKSNSSSLPPACAEGQVCTTEVGPGDETLALGPNCPKPATWCTHAGATNEYKVCGGQPGHFCSDLFGGAGFSPCSCKLGSGNCALWGEGDNGVKCEESGDSVRFFGSGRLLRSLADPNTTRAYTTAKLCLVPAGDTPTSRRLFDAMAAGCLPILMAPVEDIMPNLPFPKAINWHQTVLFGGALGCSLRDNANATISWVQSLLKPENEQKLQCMARRAQKAFLKYLSLRDEGVASALLNEINLKRVLTASDAGGSRDQARSRRPHLVVTLVDDVGYNDVGWRNSNVKTPFLDSLIRSNSEPTVELLRHYVYCVCSPTRASLLTGRLPIHVHQLGNGVEFPSRHWTWTDRTIGGMDLRMRTLPQLLVEAGYHTAHVGKWHLGSAQMAQLPSRRGFNESFAFLSGCMHTHLTHLIQPAEACDGTNKPAVDLWENESPTRGHDGVHSCELFATRAVQMIARHDPRKPLFLYVALAEAHGPYDEVPRHSAAAISCSEDTKACTQLRNYRGMIACADEATNNITEALRRQDMWKDTLMLWSSDNGAARGMGSNAPFRGHKHQMLEGGVRVVALLAGGALPHTAPPKFEGLLHVADWFATFAALAGIDDPSDSGAIQQGLPGIDSINMWPFLTGDNGKDGQRSGRSELPLGTGLAPPSWPPFCRWTALIQGDWKIINREDLDADGVYGSESLYFDLHDRDQQARTTRFSQEKEMRFVDAWCFSVENFALFNLAKDPYEQHPYLYNSNDTTSPLAIKRDELVGRLRELSTGAYQTGVTERYLHPGESTSGPLDAVCSLAKAAQAAPAGNWLLEPASPGVQPQCSAGRRGATADECLAAVQEAANGAGLEADGFKIVSDGAASVIPAGCSYSIQGKTAIFNTNAAGGTIWHGQAQGYYRLVCLAPV